MIQEAWAYLSRVAEPPAPGVVALVARLGPVEAAERIRSGRVDERVAAETSARCEVWRAEADLAAAAAAGARLITPGHPEWPTDLFEACAASGDPTLAPPVALWVRGPARLAECCARAVAVVGSRAATSYGTHLAGDLGAGLGQRGNTAVGAASQGIDAAALQGALAVAGTAIAVRPSGIDQPFPRPVALLADAVAASGLVVSEYPPGVLPSRTRLIARNRLLAALTVATVVVEAGTGSSALRVADAAARLRRPIMAVPGPVTSRLSAGCHDLIRDGAHLVTNVEDLTQRVNGHSLSVTDRRTTAP
jgi:DNA processing protein